MGMCHNISQKGTELGPLWEMNGGKFIPLGSLIFDHQYTIL